MLGSVRPLLSALFGVVGVVRRRGLPFPRPLGLPRWDGLLLLFSPRWGGQSFLIPPRFHERRASRTRQMTSPTPPCCGNFFESRWFSSSWPSSPAPHKVPEPSASPRELGLGLRAEEPDS